MKKAPRRNRRRELGTSNLECKLSAVDPDWAGGDGCGCGDADTEADYHGEEAEWLKMEAIQLALRYQVQALRKLWSLPDVYEVSRSCSFIHLPDLASRSLYH
jgi:hypothetical protein